MNETILIQKVFGEAQLLHAKKAHQHHKVCGQELLGWDDLTDLSKEAYLGKAFLALALEVKTESSCY